MCLSLIFFCKEIPSAQAQSAAAGNNLNINLPEKNAILRLEVELRDKNARRRPNRKGIAADRNRATPSNLANARQTQPIVANANTFFVPMEKVSGFSYCLLFKYTHTHTHTHSVPESKNEMHEFSQIPVMFSFPLEQLFRPNLIKFPQKNIVFAKCMFLVEMWNICVYLYLVLSYKTCVYH